MEILSGEPEGSVMDRQIGELVGIMSRLGRVFKSQLRNSDLSVPHCTMLMSVQALTKSSGNVSPGELAERFCLSGPAVTAALDELVSKGYCVRTHSDQDRRKVLVRTTAQGDAATAEAISGVVEGLRAMLHDWDEQRLGNLVSAMRDLDRAVDGYLSTHKT